MIGPADARLRSSEAFKLRPFDELAPAAQQRIAALCRDPDFYGILEPSNPLLPAKAVSKEAALLILTLATPQRVPTLIASIFGDDHGPVLALLADGVLEVEHDGVFVSGAEAVRLFQSASPPPVAEAVVAKLTATAIDVACSYEGLDAAVLAEKIYAFGRVPCTEQLRERFSRDEQLLAFLVPDEATSERLMTRWTRTSDVQSPWISWTRRSRAARLTHKLYVSARLEAMPRLFPMAVRAFDQAGCDSFKVGRFGEGVCRPDKLVAYFAGRDELRACAALLEEDLVTSEIPPRLAHGVPFTAPIDAAGFLSWGMDPPELAFRLAAASGESWRGWLASRIAVAIISARASGQGDVASFVRERLTMEGVDTATWAPNPSMWRASAAHRGDVA